MPIDDRHRAAILNLAKERYAVTTHGDHLFVVGASGASYFRWYAEQGRRLYGEIIPSHLPGSRLLALREPIGVAAAIIPWNFPSALVAWKSAAQRLWSGRTSFCMSHRRAG